MFQETPSPYRHRYKITQNFPEKFCLEFLKNNPYNAWHPHSLIRYTLTSTSVLTWTAHSPAGRGERLSEGNEGGERSLAHPAVSHHNHSHPVGAGHFSLYINRINWWFYSSVFLVCVVPTGLAWPNQLPFWYELSSSVSINYFLTVEFNRFEKIKSEFSR